MKKETVHKWRMKPGRMPADYYENVCDSSWKGNSTGRWRSVTCKRCLQSRIKNDDKSSGSVTKKDDNASGT